MTPAYDETDPVMIGEFPDIARAREALHDHARLHCLQELNAARERVAELEAIITLLGDDPSGLVHFACDHQEV
ncbi:MAG: hypothetical protein E5W56_00865 [Mesorhizobium sp.]|nr:MAG: hypothetical protein E5W56_00865 [Mesorhizobium sp.]